ncbi:hypothetical protein ILYODFUR_017306 [Ilyodon furcidens]|uniref:Uncharacterized protein n=1 Tax=Ilyodon furcidens TaxID=33524 RepID=A0ABV0SZ75_9TELE
MTRGLIHKKREQDGDVALQKVTSVGNRNKRKRSSTSNRGREEAKTSVCTHIISHTPTCRLLNSFLKRFVRSD